MKRDDALWKGIIEDLFDDFLKFYFPDSIDLLDFNRKFVFLDKELEQLFPQQQDDFNLKYVDKLVKVFTKKVRKNGFCAFVGLPFWQKYQLVIVGVF